MPVYLWSRRYPQEQQYAEALEQQNGDKVRSILLQHGAAVDLRFTPNSDANSSNRNRIVEYTGLLWAAERNNVELLTALIAAGAKVNAQLQGRDVSIPYTALHIASIHGYGSIAEALVNAGADVNLALAKNRTRIGALLGFATATKSPLHLACRNGHVDVVKALLQHPAIDVNKPSGVYCLRPIHFAVQSRNLQVLTALLSKKPNLEHPVTLPTHPYPLTAIQYALSHFIPSDTSDDDVSDTCISRLDAPSCKCSPRRSSSPSRPSCPASLLSDMIDLLLQSGADLDVRDPAGNTLLHQAITLGCSRLVDVLLRHGAPTTAMNHLGKSTWVLALDYKNDKVISLMAQYRVAVGRLSTCMYSSRGSLASEVGACETNVENMATPRNAALPLDAQTDDESSCSDCPALPCPEAYVAKDQAAAPAVAAAGQTKCALVESCVDDGPSSSNAAKVFTC